MNPKAKRAGLFTLYTVGSIRYGSLVLPAVAVAFIIGSPTWLVVTSVVLLALTGAAELFTSVVHGVAQVQEQDMVDRVYADIERYANGGQEAGEEDSSDEAGGEPVR